MFEWCRNCPSHKNVKRWNFTGVKKKKKVIHRICRCFQESSQFSVLPRSGQLCVTPQRDDHFLVLSPRKQWYITLQWVGYNFLLKSSRTDFIRLAFVQEYPQFNSFSITVSVELFWTGQDSTAGGLQISVTMLSSVTNPDFVWILMK